MRRSVNGRARTARTRRPSSGRPDDAQPPLRFGALICETSEVELVCTPSLSICCFRYHPHGIEDEDYLNRLNTRIVTELQVDGTVFSSNASVRGRAAIRSCIVTYRAEAAHLERLLELALATGARLHAAAVVA